MIKIKNFFKKVLNIFFPKDLKCIFCGKDIPNFEEQPFCNECAKADFFNDSKNRCLKCDVHFLGGGEYCSNCKTENRNFNKAVCPFIYKGKVRSAILKLKGYNAKYLAATMAKFMSQRVVDANLPVDVIIPVPSSKKAIKQRGFNQAEILAKEIAKILNKPVKNDILIKTTDTKNQKNLNFSQRQNNLKNSFEINNKNLIKDKNILIIDDIITTCATVNTCSVVLNKYAKCVNVAAFARTEKK